MRIQHNIPAMAAYRNYTNNTSAVAKNLEKLSSGYKINRAGDDAAGLAVSEKMRAQITGLEAAQKNAKDGISLVQTAEGALTEVHDMLNRMYELAELASNGTYDDEVDRANYQKEIESLSTEINRIADSVNFNGINLLDGSLADKQTITKIEIGGNAASTKSAGSKGSWTSLNNLTGAAGFADGDTFDFTVALSDGTSKTIKLTMGPKADGTASGALLSEDGTILKELATAGTLSATDLADTIVSELNKTELANTYKISHTAGVIKFEALENGTSTPSVVAMDFQASKAGVANAGNDDLIKKVNANVSEAALGVTSSAGLDDGREIDFNSLTVYDGTNYEDAVFTINGHKFVLMTSQFNASGTGNNAAGTTGSHSFMNATQGLGSDVTILISSGDNTTNGLDNNAPDDNFEQNIKKIAEVTGLTVTDAITETGGNTGAAPGSGIRLSPGKSTGGGLTLQIGDTADEFNKMKVSIDDMHTDAMGIGSINVGTQAGASAAMARIKDAINYVSNTRGTLGATQNRLDHTINNLSVMQENIQDAESTIRDVDIAKEMMAYTKNNILVQSAQAMLAQANQLPQGVLQLLQ